MKKKTKRFLASLTAAAAISAVCCPPPADTGIRLPITALEASAAEIITSGDYQYFTSEEGATIKKYKGTASVITIPEEIDGNKVIAIDRYAFERNINLTSVTFPSGLLKIGNNAFNGCSSLSSVKFNEGLTTLGSFSFSDTALTEISLPSTLKDATSPFNNCDITKASFAEGTETIPSFIFKNCHKLTDVTIPKTVKRIGSYAFNDCTSLKDFNFHEGITFLGNYSFSGTALTEVSLPSTLTDAAYPFNNCDITKASFAEGTETIPSFIFKNCHKLTDVTIPKTVKRIGSYAFNDCTSLKDFNFHEGITFLGSYSFSGTALTEVTLPSTLTDAAYPFNNSNITKASFAEGTETIPSFIFKNCHKLTDAVLPETVTRIGNYAFSDCSSLKDFNFHEGITFLGNSSFSGTAITEVKLPSTLTEAAYSFNGSGITKASFAENTKTIPSFLFYNCYKLTDVSLPETLTQINNYAFTNCSSLSTIELNEGLEKIGSNAFTATAITEITLPSTIKTGGYAFAKSKLEKASFAKGAVSVPTQMFGNCRQLREVTLPETIKSINGYAFENCVQLRSIELPSSLEKLESSCFKASGLTGIVLPDSVKNIGTSSFINCANLKTATIGSGLTVISSTAFSNCTALEKVTLTSAKLKASANAFYNCRRLSEVDYSNTSFSFDKSSFAKCYSLKDTNLVYLERPVSDMTINTENTAVNGLVEFSVEFEALADHYNSDSEFTLALTIPDGVTVLPETFKTEAGTVDAEAVSALKIPFSASNGKLTFSAKAEKTGSFDIDADLIFTDGKLTRTEPIDSVRFTADEFSISAPSTVNSLKFNINGKGPKGKKIDVYLGDKLIGSPSADEATGKFTLAVELPESEDGTEYVLKAKYGDLVTSDVKVVYSAELPAVNSIKLSVNDSSTSADITDVFTNYISPVMLLVPSKPFTFTADISNSSSVEKVYITSTKEDEVRKLEAVYDTETKTWIAKGFFDGVKGYVPGELNIVVVTKSEYSSLQAAKLDTDYTKGYYPIPGNIRFTVDPSGIVYEAAPSNPIKGAEVSVYCMDKDGKAVLWDAKDFDQQNPLLTDESGAFAWDIPEGEWKVECKAEGFDKMESEWLTVPPVQKGINFALVSNASPEVTDISYDGQNINLKFSKYMIPDTITTNTVTLDSGNDIIITPSYHISGEDLTDTFVISGDFSETIDVNIEVTNGCFSYANASAENFKKTLRIHEPVTTTTTAATTTTTTTTTSTTTSTTKATTTSTTTKPATTTSTTKATTTSTTTKPATTTSTTKATTTSTAVTTTTPVTTTTQPIETETHLGDYNNDGSINAIDASYILTAYAENSTNHREATAEQLALGDVNKDGKINAVDASYVLSYYAYCSTNAKISLEEYLKQNF